MLWLIDIPKPIPLICEINYCVAPNKKKELENVIREKKMINYWLGCEGRRNGCKEWTYDCSWIITACLREAWLRTGRKLTTATFDTIWEEIPLKQAEYGDFIVMKPDPKYSWRNHLAFILEGWDGKGVVVLDWVQKKQYSSNARFIGWAFIEKVFSIKY